MVNEAMTQRLWISFATLNLPIVIIGFFFAVKVVGKK